jgi:O-antigen biosynthesis protein WbqP
MKRIFDLLLSSIFLIILIGPILLLSVFLFLNSKSSIIYWSKRIGRNGKIFNMPKFRTMRKNTPQLATHLISDSEIVYTKFGKFLRNTSIDELPQIYSVIKGDMSIVGPRPALFNQYDLILLRSENQIDQLLPGITGLAQINGRDELSIKDKVDLDLEYLYSKSFTLDLKILFLTIFKVAVKQNISH